MVKHRPSELVEAAVYYLHSRTLWKEVKDLAYEDEILRALRFWFITQASFGGRGQHFGTRKAGGGPASVLAARQRVAEVADRLKHCQIETLDFADCLQRYDSPETFFYLDPPYRGTKGGKGIYEHLTDDRWRELAALLKGIKGKWLLSHTPDPLIGSLFKGYKRETLSVAEMLSKTQKTGKRRREWLIRNYGSAVAHRPESRRAGSRD